MKVHVAGPYACGNFGNDCSIDIVRSHLLRVWDGAEISISDIDAAEFSPTEQDACVLAGSGLLCGRTYDSGTDSLRHFLRYPAAMQWFDKRSYLLGVGVQGQLQSGIVGPYLPTFDAMQLRTVRDSTSAAILREVGVTSPVLECADLAYLNPPVPIVGNTQTKFDSRPVLGVVASQPDRGVIYSGSDSFENRIRDVVASLSNRFDLRFFSFDRAADDWLPASWGATPDWVTYDTLSSASIRTFTQAISSVDILLTSRFHGLILAASMGIPFVALGATGEKNERECNALGYPFFARFEATTNEIIHSIDDVWSERCELRRMLETACAARVRLAQRSIDVLRTRELSPESLAPEVFTAVRDQSRGDKTLLLWAAPESFALESRPALEALAPFDCVVGPSAMIDHAGVSTLLVLPRPGIMNWAAFPENLQRRLDGAYDRVVVCHLGTAGSLMGTSLAEIASRASAHSGARGVWDYSLWTQTAQPARAESFKTTFAEVGVAI